MSPLVVLATKIVLVASLAELLVGILIVIGAMVYFSGGESYYDY